MACENYRIGAEIASVGGGGTGTGGETGTGADTDGKPKKTSTRNMYVLVVEIVYVPLRISTLYVETAWR